MLIAAPWVTPLLALELIALWALSLEFGGLGTRLGRRLLRSLQMQLDPDCSRVRLDIAAIERALQRAVAYRTVQPALGARTDTWREGCWDFIAYGALYERQATTVIFAAPALFDPRKVSSAVVVDTDNTNLLAVLSQRGTTPSVAYRE